MFGAQVIKNEARSVFSGQGAKMPLVQENKLENRQVENEA